MFFVFKKGQVILFSLLILLVAAAFAFSSYSSTSEAELCKSFIEALGYRPEEKPFDKADIQIPEGFGSVFENYRALNSEAGFDLLPLRGAKVTRYSFYLEGDEPLYANILIKDKKICGGDICNPALSGYMLPLVKKED